MDLTAFVREIEAAHRQRQSDMARWRLFPRSVGPFPPLVPSSPPPTGWEFAEHPTDRLLRELLSTLHNPVELWRRLVTAERQRAAVKAMQTELDRTTGFVRTVEPGPHGYSSLSPRLPGSISVLERIRRTLTRSGDSSSQGDKDARSEGTTPP